MKLNHIGYWHTRDCSSFYKISFLMRVSSVVAFILCANLSIASNAQRISLSEKNESLRTVIEKIKKQSGYSFFYVKDDLKMAHPVTIQIKNAPLNEALSDIFSNQPLSYIIDNKVIVIRYKAAIQAALPQHTVHGRVTDTAGTPLAGVTVLIRNSKKGTFTNSNGEYTIEVTKGDVIEFSFVGYKAQNITTSNNDQIDIQLHTQSSSLNDLVIIGYGTQRKKLVTGATAHVSGSLLENLSTTNALQALQGQVAGVNITSVSGQPGGGIDVKIRGAGTIGNASPTYIVDGVMTNDISYLNNSDIASVDVLKDAASAAIYGVNGANGVVLITTRGGNSAPATGQISLDAYYGLQNVAHKVPMLNARQYATIVNEAAVNSGKSPYFAQAMIDTMGSGTNWQDLMFARNVPTRNINIAANGNSKTTVYSLAFSYNDQGGIVGGSDLSNYQRYNIRVNTENKLYDGFLKIGEHFTYSHVNLRGIKDQGQYNNSLRGALQTSPFLPNTDSNGNWVNSATYTIPYYTNGVLGNSVWFSGEANPYAQMILGNQNETKSDKMLGDVYAELSILKNLKLRSDYGLEYNGSTYHSYTPVYPTLSAYVSAAADPTGLSQNSLSNYNWQWENTATLTLRPGKNHFDFLLGNSLRHFSGVWENVSNTGSTLFNDLYHAYLSNSLNTTNAATMSLSGDADAVIAHASFFGRVNYDYNETYLATLVARYDGSTMFDRGYQWGFFPSISLGWVLSNEAFMKDLKNTINFLKIRASWGNNGNDNIAEQFAYESLINFNNAQYNFGDDQSSLASGSYPSTIGTANLKWETSQQTDIGVDARFFNGRLSANFDWYNKNTKNWLVAAPVLATYGVSTAPFINGGSVTNRGIEFSLNWSDQIGNDFRYSVSGSYTYNKNVVGHIPTTDGIIHGGSGILFDNSTEFFRAQDGYPIGYFWGYKVAGIFQNEQDVLNWKGPQGQQLQPTAQPGDVKYAKISDDGQAIDANDKTMIGDPNPHHLFGLSLNTSWKGFDLSITSSGAAGNSIVQSYRNIANHYGNYTTAILDRWHGEGTSNTMPRVTENNSNWTNFSSLYIHSGSYLRINNITLGYDFSKMIHSKYVHQLRLYAAAENLYTFTKYNGLDPEVGFAAPDASGVYSFGQGVDVGTYPHARTILVGVNVKF